MNDKKIKSIINTVPAVSGDAVIGKFTVERERPIYTDAGFAGLVKYVTTYGGTPEYHTHPGHDDDDQWQYPEIDVHYPNFPSGSVISQAKFVEMFGRIRSAYR